MESTCNLDICRMLKVSMGLRVYLKPLPAIIPLTWLNLYISWCLCCQISPADGAR